MRERRPARWRRGLIPATFLIATTRASDRGQDTTSEPPPDARAPACAVVAGLDSGNVPVRAPRDRRSPRVDRASGSAVDRAASDGVAPAHGAHAPARNDGLHRPRAEAKPRFGDYTIGSHGDPYVRR